MTSEIKVGLLLVAAMTVLAWLSVASGTFGFGRDERMRELFAVFNDVEGIVEDSPVKMAGVDVGKVTKVELQPNGTAVLRFEVKESVALPADVSAQIDTSGLIGERFVALVPGASGRAGEGGLLPKSVTQLPVAVSADPAAIRANFAKVAEDMQSVTEMLKQVLGNPETAAKLQKMIDTLAKFSEGLEGNTGQTMQDLSVAAANLAEISRNLKNGDSVLGQLVARQPSGTQADMRQTIEDLNSAVADFRDIMGKINGGEGSLGKLVNDPSTAEKLDDALDTVNGIGGWLGVSGDDSRTSLLPRFRAEGTIESAALLGEDDIYTGGALARVQAGNTFVEVGASGDGFAAKAGGSDNINGPYYGKDFGSEMKYTAQVGRVLPGALMGNDIALRAGLKNSSAGLGLDAYGRVPGVDKLVKVSADVYDFAGNDTPRSRGNGDKPHVDLMARTDLIGERVYGVVGYGNVLSEDYGAPVVGVGVKFQTSGPGTSKYVARKDL